MKLKNIDNYPTQSVEFPESIKNALVFQGSLQLAREWPTNAKGEYLGFGVFELTQELQTFLIVKQEEMKKYHSKLIFSRTEKEYIVLAENEKLLELATQLYTAKLHAHSKTL